MANIHELLERAISRRASDLVVKAGAQPALRVNGQMELLPGDRLGSQDTREIAYQIMYSASRDVMLRRDNVNHGAEPHDEMADADGHMHELEHNHELDLVFTIPSRARVRANLFMEQGTVGATLRLIPLHPYTIDELNLPQVLKRFAMEPSGLILITGPTGCGKTTTMAAIIEEINVSRNANVFCIEEPVEYVFTDKKSVIHQREVGTDTQSFAMALRSVTRQSPDVIAIGEVRDRETMEVALTAAEIGHLVICTLHTISAATTVDRIVNASDSNLRSQVSQQLSDCLVCVASQRLVHRADGTGRLPAVEILTNSPTIKKQLEDGDTHDLYNNMREGAHFDMVTMNQVLERMVKDGVITSEEALRSAGGNTELRQLLRR